MYGLWLLHCRVLIRLAATYSPAYYCSTIGPTGLNFSVRHGKRWSPAAWPPLSLKTLMGIWHICGRPTEFLSYSWKLRAISTAQLSRYRCYTCSLSTSSSLTALKGDLILRRASHLDAFSAYHYPTWLPSAAPGGTTGAPVVGPTRSSRTKVRSSQISNARNR